MKTYTITFKDGKTLVATNKRTVLFNENNKNFELQPDTLYLNAHEIKFIKTEET